MDSQFGYLKGTNFRELFFLSMFEVQFFVFGLLSFTKMVKYDRKKLFYHHNI